MEKILIAGGSGLIGQALARYLTDHNYLVYILSRQRETHLTGQAFQWDLKAKHIDARALEDLHGVINLAGAGIVDKAWTEERKALLHASRIGANQLLAEKLNLQSSLPQVYISGSAIGYYGQRPGEILDEESGPGQRSFLVDLCRDWEQSADPIAQLGIRTCLLRTGLVLSREGGILPTLLKTMPLGIGTYFGDGKMGVSWIHMDDLCRLMHWMIRTTSIEGPVNGAAPNPVPYRQFVRSLVNYKGGLKIIVPTPTFAMKMIMGDRTQAILQDATVIPAKSQRAGFEFKFPKIQQALADLKTT